MGISILFTLLVWVIAFGVIGWLFTIIINSVPMLAPFRGVAIAILALIGIFIILALLTGGIHLHPLFAG